MRTKAKLGISSKKTGMDMGWMWTLSNDGSDTASKDAEEPEGCHF